MRFFCLCVSLLFVSLLGGLGCGETKEPEPTGPTKGTFRILSYNVHGLPPGIAKKEYGNPYERLEKIGPLSKPFGIIGMQEVFDEKGFNSVTAAKTHTNNVHFDELKKDRTVNSGLLMLTNLKVLEKKTVHYEKCYGFIDGAGDCFASKGLQFFRLELGKGLVVDVYNSHLEAGGGDKDKEARASHVEVIKKSMQAWSKGTAMLFFADLNLHEFKKDRPDDAKLIQSILKTAGLKDSCEAVNCSDKGRIDRIFFRSGGGVTLNITKWQMDPIFKDKDGKDLSDHKPIAATLEWKKD